MPESEEKLLESATILRLEPGDILVIKSDRRVSRALLERLQGRMQERFPEHKVLVLEAGLSLEVVRGV